LRFAGERREKRREGGITASREEETTSGLITPGASRFFGAWYSFVFITLGCRGLGLPWVTAKLPSASRRPDDGQAGDFDIGTVMCLVTWLKDTVCTVHQHVFPKTTVEKC
jgi:hypothetical protein